MTVEADEILAFIRQEVPPPYFTDLSLSTDLRKDLRMLEDDAEDLLVKLFEHFGIDRGDFEFTRYFPAEGSPFTIGWKRKAEAVPVTVGMLWRAAAAGVWETAKIEM